MTLWGFNVYKEEVMESENTSKVFRRQQSMEITWSLYADDLILYGKSEENLNMIFCYRREKENCSKCSVERGERISVKSIQKDGN